MRDCGLAINDLHALVAQDGPRYICDDLTHLSEAGKEACARQVTASILSMLG